MECYTNETKMSTIRKILIVKCSYLFEDSAEHRHNVLGEKRRVWTADILDNTVDEIEHWKLNFRGNLWKQIDSGYVARTAPVFFDFILNLNFGPNCTITYSPIYHRPINTIAHGPQVKAQARRSRKTFIQSFHYKSSPSLHIYCCMQTQVQ